MKPTSLFTLMACGILLPSLHAQTATPPTPPKTSTNTTRKQVLPSPASLRPKPIARVSTSEAGPMHAAWKPLTVLPALALVDRNGTATTIPAATALPPHWFLLYRKAACVPCDRLMLALQASTSPQFKAGKPYVILVDDPNSDALERVHTNFAGLSDATWTADRQKLSATTLKLHGSPVLIAMDGPNIAWRIAGSLDSTETVVRLTDGWLAANGIKSDQHTIHWTQANQAALAASAAASASPTPTPTNAPPSSAPAPNAATTGVKQ